MSTGLDNFRVPEGSIYFWMYEQGLKQINLDWLIEVLINAGRQVRQKDIDNYWNGFHRSNLYGKNNPYSMFVLKKFENKSPSNMFTNTPLSNYPGNPNWYLPDIEERWVPCNAANKPMVKWSKGCMSKEDAEAYIHQRFLAENTKGTKYVIIDCDGDHGDEIDLCIIKFLYQFTSRTHTIFKPKLIPEYEGYEDSEYNLPASFHLTFFTDRIIPTMHFPGVHMDIIGNKENSLRYWKNKIWNGKNPIMMTPMIWNMLRDYVKENDGRKDIHVSKFAVDAGRTSTGEATNQAHIR